jgi:N,N'-diacetyllegionaminate synthase
MAGPFIIAEIAQGYEGNAKLVDLYVKAAAFAGADAIKFQIFYADELALRDYKYYRLFKSLELPCSVWKKAVLDSHMKGLEFYSDIFGFDSLKKLREIGVDGFKIHATDVNNMPLLERLAKTRGKIFLSTGGCQQDEVSRALDILDKCKVTLMYGFQAEPTEMEDNNLKRITTIKKIFGKPVGFQDHTLGDSDLAVYPSFVALGLGAELIEKHLTLSRAAQIEDYISALEPDEFKSWVYAIKKTFPVLGAEEWKLAKKEIEYRLKVKRAVCSRRIIKKGAIITEEDILLKRTGSKNAIYEISGIIGKKSQTAIKANSVIEEGFVK